MELTLNLPENNIGFDLCEKMFEENHVLIAGCTGSGKSVLIDNFIWHVIGRRFPFLDDPNGVQFVLIDPKRVDLVEYKTVPHVIRYEYEFEGIRSTLDDVIKAMDSRYKYMHSKGIKKYDKGHMIIIIDELADLMTTHAREVLPRLQRIAQLGRAAKIHLICATQAPSRKVIPAELTLNFTGLIGLHCRSAIESNQIIGMDGAENLPKNGRCIFVRGDGEVEYCDIAMLPENEYKNRIEFWEKQETGGLKYDSYSEGTIKTASVNADTTNSTPKKVSVPEYKPVTKAPAKVPASKKVNNAANEFHNLYKAFGNLFKAVIPAIITIYFLINIL